MLMVYAYWIHPDQVQKTSGWMDSGKFDIAAKPEGFVPEDQLRRMLQAMLAERFKLMFHHDQKELPVYVLTVAKGGSKMKARMRGESWSWSPPGVPGQQPARTERCDRSVDFVLQTRVLDRPTIDETGLNGKFDFDLSWSPEGVRGDVRPADSDSPDLFTAIEKQLGLKLSARRGPVDVLVVDHAEKPDAN
jgi:uncharacterized protein (TIGR03435 family)